METPPPTAAMPVPQPAAAGPGIVSSGWLGPQSIFERRDENAFRRAAGATGVTLTFYSILALLLLFTGLQVSQQIVTPDQEMPKFVYLNQPGPGGGGGGSPAPAPPKPMEVPHHKAPDPVPVEPVATPPPPTPIPTLNAPIETNAASIIQAQGSSSVSLAMFGGGGSGGGIGSGRGNGVGPGTGGGFGGGAYRPGNGVSPPSLIRQVEPKYTSDAMRAKVQGDVELEAVVNANGTIGEVRIVKSLDDKYGLDLEAIKAAKQWFFKPGVGPDGKPTSVIVTLILSFRLH
jgi:protein TonB